MNHPDRLTSGHNKETAEHPINVGDLLLEHGANDLQQLRGKLLVELGPSDESDGYTGRHRDDVPTRVHTHLAAARNARIEATR